MWRGGEEESQKRIWYYERWERRGREEESRRGEQERRGGEERRGGAGREGGEVRVGRGTHIVLLIDIRFPLYQHLHHLLVVIESCEVEWRVAILPHGRKRGEEGEGRRGGRGTHFVLFIHICFGLDQPLHHLLVALLSREVER